MRKRATVLLFTEALAGCVVTHDGVEVLAVPTTPEEALVAAVVSAPLMAVSGLAVATTPRPPRATPRRRAPHDATDRELEARWEQVKRRRK